MIARRRRVVVAKSFVAGQGVGNGVPARLVICLMRALALLGKIQDRA
jgi:hypothetical protein